LLSIWQEQFTRILRSGLTIVTLMDGQTYTYDRIAPASKLEISAMLGAWEKTYRAWAAPRLGDGPIDDDIDTEIADAAE